MRFYEFYNLKEGWYYDNNGKAVFDPYYQIHTHGDDDLMDIITLSSLGHTGNLTLDTKKHNKAYRLDVNAKLEIPKTDRSSEFISKKIPVFSGFRVNVDSMVGFTLWKEVKGNKVDPKYLELFLDTVIDPIVNTFKEDFKSVEQIDLLISPRSTQPFNDIFIKKLGAALGVPPKNQIVSGLKKRVLILPGEENDTGAPEIEFNLINPKDNSLFDKKNIISRIKSYRDPITKELEMKQVAVRLANMNIRDKLKRFFYPSDQVASALVQLVNQTVADTSSTINIVIMDDDRYHGDTLTLSSIEILYTIIDILKQNPKVKEDFDYKNFVLKHVNIFGITSLTNEPLEQSETQGLKSKHQLSLADEKNIFLPPYDAEKMEEMTGEAIKQFLNANGFDLDNPPPKYDVSNLKANNIVYLSQIYSIIKTLLSGKFDDANSLSKYFFKKNCLGVFNAQTAFALVHLLKINNKISVIKKLGNYTYSSYDAMQNLFMSAYEDIIDVDKKITPWAIEVISRYNIAITTKTKHGKTPGSWTEFIDDAYEDVYFRKFESIIREPDTKKRIQDIETKIKGIVNNSIDFHSKSNHAGLMFFTALLIIDLGEDGKQWVRNVINSKGFDPEFVNIAAQYSRYLKPLLPEKYKPLNK